MKELAKRKPLRAVFRDSSYDSDSTKINVAQIFKLLSPKTEVKCLYAKWRVSQMPNTNLSRRPWDKFRAASAPR